ncbi:carboxymuconolactone decarboxylase family protein [Enterobacter cloacae]|uniref:carboxymuconolactone decarboxylase family protein n=1 Tax=Enterobacter cloacae TaxID=550 RepID=UPI002005B0BE|nr:carboxymuconolactone decarboxylase family protein [Enterobacter cloacae]MCK7164599.1 carboxymuconolactone decarboxylase family protein [Enterobacter cloacae]
MTEQDTRLAIGLATVERLSLPLGNEHGLLHGMRLQAPVFKQQVLENLGDHFAQTQPLDEKTRCLLAVALSSCRGQTPALLEFFTAAALKMGWSRAEIENAVQFTALFQGWPDAIGAMQTVMTTYEKAEKAEQYE